MQPYQGNNDMTNENLVLILTKLQKNHFILIENYTFI